MAWDYEKTIRELQDTMTVVVGIQARLEAGLKNSVEWLETLQLQAEVHARRMAEHEALMAEHDRRMAEHDTRMAEHDKRMEKIDERLFEMTEKLDAMIHIVDDHLRGGSHPQS